VLYIQVVPVIPFDGEIMLYNTTLFHHQMVAQNLKKKHSKQQTSSQAQLAQHEDI